MCPSSRNGNGNLFSVRDKSVDFLHIIIHQRLSANVYVYDWVSRGFDPVKSTSDLSTTGAIPYQARLSTQKGPPGGASIDSSRTALGARRSSADMVSEVGARKGIHDELALRCV